MRPELKSKRKLGARERLAQAGLRGTPHRSWVYETLLASKDHPSAEEIFVRSREEGLALSMATVYNCLEALEEHGLIRRLHLEQGPTRFEANLEPHGHFVDTESGEVVDVELTPSLIHDLEASAPEGTQVREVRIQYLGTRKTS